MNFRHFALRVLKKKSYAAGIATVLGAIGCGPDETGEPSASGGAGTGGAAPSSSGGATGGTVGSGGATGSGGAESGGSGGSETGGSGGADPRSEACHDASDAGYLTTRLPCLLSETGLYESDMVTLAPGVHPFAPQFPLWTDGAVKRRWIRLPEGTKIDTTEMDYWSYPAGTRLWKEFVRDEVRVETRLIEKQESGAWYMVAYQWRDDLSEADAVPNGVENASGTEHDIPNVDDCLKCHSQQPDKALGFSAIQLSHDPIEPGDQNEWTLERLMDADLLTAPPAQPFVVPGTDVERSFFGYVHANCGHCHNPRGAANSQTGLDLWMKVADLAGPVNEFSVYKGIVDSDLGWLDGQRPAASKRIASGSLDDSAIYQRFATKGEAWSMPPLGTEITDPAGKKAMEDFIESLAP